MLLHVWSAGIIVCGLAKTTQVRMTADMRPRLGILASHAIQYHSPLYKMLAVRGNVDLEVAFLRDMGATPYLDPGFGKVIAWDIDLLTGYASVSLRRPGALSLPRSVARMLSWIRRHDVVVIHGHSDPWMLLASVACRVLGVPYLLRGESHAPPASSDWRQHLRHLVAGLSVRNAAGALVIGTLNRAFYSRYGAIPQYWAPYAIDNKSFEVQASQSRGNRSERLRELGLDPALPTVLFVGKLIPRKHPLDAVAALEQATSSFNLLIVGDGELRDDLRRRSSSLPIHMSGFVNQADLPNWYALADVLVLPSEHETWGIVVNEAMACGLVPIVSDKIGSGPDLVTGVGKTFPLGDTQALAACIDDVISELPLRRKLVAERIGEVSLEATALGYEQAAFAQARPSR